MAGSFGDGMRSADVTLRASSTGSGLERFQSALSTQPSWSVQPGAWPPPQSPWGGAFSGLQQQDLPQLPLPSAQKGPEVRISGV